MIETIVGIYGPLLALLLQYTVAVPLTAVGWVLVKAAALCARAAGAINDVTERWI